MINKTLVRWYASELTRFSTDSYFPYTFQTVAGIDPKVMQSDNPKARMSQLQTLQDILMVRSSFAFSSLNIIRCCNSEVLLSQYAMCDCVESPDTISLLHLSIAVSLFQLLHPYLLGISRTTPSHERTICNGLDACIWPL